MKASNSMRALMLALGVCVIGAVVVMVTQQSGGDRELARAPLPVPREPEVRPLLARGHGGIGWTWINPLPRWMPTWNAIDVDSAGNAIAVGLLGHSVSYEDGGLLAVKTGTEQRLRGVVWTAPGEALAVGDQGTIVRLTRADPRPIASETTVALRAVAVVSPDAAWAVGDDGTILSIATDGRVTPIAAAALAGKDLLAITKRGEDVYVTGEGGLIAVFRNGQLAEQSNVTDVPLRAIGGCDTDFYAVGDQGRVLRRNENRWDIVRVDTRATLEGIACTGEHAIVVGGEGVVMLVSGDDSVRIPSGHSETLHAVGADGEHAWIAGEGGRLASFEGDHLRILTGGPTDPIRDVATIGGAIVGVGEWGRIIRESEAGFSQAQSPTKAGLAAVRTLDETRALAVGDEGALVEIGPTDARLLRSPTDRALRDLLIENGQVLAIGVGGTLLRGAPDNLVATRIAGDPDLWSIDGTLADAIAVGEHGAIVHITESGSSRWACDLDLSLRAVVKAPAGVFAAGEGGVILRLEPTVCTVERRGDPATPTLHGIGIGPHGRPLAVGDGGLALERDDAGVWSDSTLDVGRAGLRNVARVERFVYLVGTGGVVVRHIAVDGS